MIKNIFYGLICVLLSFPLMAENHAKSSVNSDFDKAIKLVEEKNFFEAFKVFSDLAEADVPEAQYNLSLLFFNGLGAPKNYKLALYWAWQAHLNEHDNAFSHVNSIFDVTNEDLRNTVANQVIEELLLNAQNGDDVAPLKLGKTYLGLFVEAQNQPAYLWLSISQAYGNASASPLLEQAAGQLTLEDILKQQDKALSKFQEIIEKN
jgi:TPR repeat protein